MDDCSGKTALGSLVSKKASPYVLRDTANTRDRNAQFCNRTGRSGRLNTKGSSFGSSEKSKISKPLLHSTNRKEIIGSSSGSKPSKSSSEAQKKLSPRVERDSSEKSSIQDKPEASELVPPPGKVQKGLHREPSDDQCSKAISMEAGSSSVAVSTKSRKSSNKKSGVTTQGILAGSAIPSTSRSKVLETRGATTRYSLRSIRCNSLSDTVQSSSSSIDSSLNKRKEAVKKRNYEGETSSSAKGKAISSSFSSGRNPNSGVGICISEARRTRNNPPKREKNGCALVRTGRSSGSTTARTSNQRTGNSISTHELRAMESQIAHPDVPIRLNTHIRSPQFLAETSSRASSHNWPSCGNAVISVGSSEVATARSSVNHNSFPHYNIDGIAEVLLELERIEQEEELTYEQMLVLDSFLFLNGLNFYDQHRDMRLDIDNMSYEELLALEERMGTVSTALSEEALSNCLKGSIYQASSLEDRKCCAGDTDDTKCSICQEEYVGGDEVGRLQCKHRFHVACIHQWLRLKNWCPICKSSAEPSKSAASS